MYDLKCTCPTTKSPIDELTKWSFCFRQFIHSFYDRTFSAQFRLVHSERRERAVTDHAYS